MGGIVVEAAPLTHRGAARPRVADVSSASSDVGVVGAEIAGRHLAKRAGCEAEMCSGGKDPETFISDGVRDWRKCTRDGLW